ncbi:hypothetical protein FHL15_001059 [Xylaria flabelliformis]|uniref:Uncharacterized protein n=1 Tax=Xylaria flabelliformis TaxID=2512241 RepID=A0A553ICC4_9PEZI|nr:hypothetical protein FHL15_001059 [Xylaria flabelliformis]
MVSSIPPEVSNSQIMDLLLIMREDIATMRENMATIREDMAVIKDIMATKEDMNKGFDNIWLELQRSVHPMERNIDEVMVVPEVKSQIMDLLLSMNAKMATKEDAGKGFDNGCLERKIHFITIEGKIDEVMAKGENNARDLKRDLAATDRRIDLMDKILAVELKKTQTISASSFKHMKTLSAIGLEDIANQLKTNFEKIGIRLKSMNDTLKVHEERTELEAGNRTNTLLLEKSFLEIRDESLFRK